MKATEQVFEPSPLDMAERDSILSALENAPPDDGKGNPEIRGWWTPRGWYLCRGCAQRLLRRGYVIRAVPVWFDPPEPFGPCINCERGKN